MLAGDHPSFPKSTEHNTYHEEPSLSSTHYTRVMTRKSYARQSFSTGDSTNLTHSSYPTSSQQQTQVHSRHRPISTASTLTSMSAPAVRAVASTDSLALTKEKEFMANTRILAMSNLIDSFALSSSHAKQGFYGKQLKVIGSASSSPSSTGAELDLAVKIHIIENTWTTCPLLAPSTILHRWKVTHLNSSNNQLDSESFQDDFVSDLGYSKNGKRSSWVQTTVDRTETISPAPSPTYEQRSTRPLSTSSISSYSGQNVAQQTHVAVISNALCFVANKSGDYLVQLSIHVPFVAGAGSQSIHLSQIPKCRSNFIKFRVGSCAAEESNDGDGDAGSEVETVKDQGEYEGARGKISDGFEFNVHPKIKSLDESHLNPDSDEDAQFWLEVQELLIGRDGFVGKLTANDDSAKSSPETQEDTQDSLVDGISNGFEIAGCFTPSSSLHVSWMSRNAVDFVQDVEQEMTIHIAGKPDQTKSSTLLQHRKRKDPEVSQAIDQTDQEEDPTEYEHLVMEDGDLIISVKDVLTLNVQKLGWKQPFMDFTIDLSDTRHSQINEMSLLEITGDAVQDYEAIISENSEQTPSELESLDKESTVDHERHFPAVYRVWFFPGTEGSTTLHVHVRVGQAVGVGYYKDIPCNIPKIQVHGARLDKGRIHIHTSSDIMIQRPRCITHHLESSLIDGHSLPEDFLSTRHQQNQHYQYQSSDYRLTVVVQRYQTISRIARIEMIKAEIGVSGRQQQGFARVILSNVVLPQQDDPYLRIYQLEGAEIWSVLVDGSPCAKSVQSMGKKSGGQHTIMVPIPEGTTDSDNSHQVEISYGFNTVDREQGEDLDDETVNPTIRLAVPGFNIPVGEYLVVASLPKLPKDMDYEEPVGDFDIISELGTASHRKTITYGAFMTLDRPKLSIKASRIAVVPQILQNFVAEAAEYVDQSEILEQITRTHTHTNAVAHDPQQPTFNTGPIIVHQTSQRHPQQPLDPHNPQVEQPLDGEILPVLIARPNGMEGGVVQTGQTSNLSPQVSSNSFSPGHWLAQLQCQIGFLGKNLVVMLAASLLVIMIVNVAHFQDTMSTSLDPVHVPAWQRSFAAIGRLWYDKSSSRQSSQYNDPDIDSNEFFVPAEPDMEVLEPKTTKTVLMTSAETRVAEATQDLEIRGPRAASKDDRFSSDDERDDTRKQPAGFMKLVQMLKRIVGGT
ncbi:hypothetical protein BGX27_006628 [Mortierella sp. AM989]|nr:hypothetical protein BGX27_006628 [Mortierella sp. AM989]